MRRQSFGKRPGPIEVKTKAPKPSGKAAAMGLSDRLEGTDDHAPAKVRAASNARL